MRPFSVIEFISLPFYRNVSMYQLFKMVLAFAGCQFAVLGGIFQAIMLAGHALQTVSVPFRTLPAFRLHLSILTFS